MIINEFQFIRDLFIGICHCLSMSKETNLVNEKNFSFDCKLNLNFKIKKHHLKFHDDTLVNVGKF